MPAFSLPWIVPERTPLAGEISANRSTPRPPRSLLWLEAAAERIQHEAPKAAAAAEAKADEVRALAERLGKAIAELKAAEGDQAQLRALIVEPGVGALLGEAPALPRFGGFDATLLRLLDQAVVGVRSAGAR